MAGRAGRARRLAGPGFRPAATAWEGAGRASRSGAAPRGAEVKAGSQGGGRVRLPGRARRLAERRFKQAAASREGAGAAPRPGAAPHAAGVRTGSDGGSRPGLRFACGRPVREAGGRGIAAPPSPRHRERSPPHPPTWTNTDSEEEEEHPAHLDVASSTAESPSRHGSGRQEPRTASSRAPIKGEPPERRAKESPEPGRRRQKGDLAHSSPRKTPSPLL